MLNFCTLFDINFISQGLAMYESLKEHCRDDFTLYVFAFCRESYELLKELNFDNLKVISLDELEQEFPKLPEVKKDRSKGEYCWTCSSLSILYCIKKFNLKECTYLDSDIYFYSDPKALTDEMGDKSVLITEHRFTPEYDQTEAGGKYCVQFMTFKNDENGMKVLNWWADRCIEWCYGRLEDGKFGDQKYLDDWLERFDGVHSLEHLGGGAAPWNIQQYSVKKRKQEIFINNYPLVFYHFQNIKVNDDGEFSPTHYNFYRIALNVENIIYKPYLKKLSEISKKLHEKNNKVKIIKNKFQKTDFKYWFKMQRRKFFQIKLGREPYIILFGKKIV